MKCDYDVIVVGGGPGGSTAARFCAQAGLKTLVVEKDRLPRYKPCGGCLSLKTVQLLDLDLSPVIENTILGAKFTYCLRDPFFINSRDPIAFMVMRERFDQFLINKAQAEGAKISEGEKVIRVKEMEDGIEVGLGSGGSLCCEFLIGADGPESIVAKSFSLLPRKRNGIALESEVPFEAVVDFSKEDRHLIHLDFGRVPNGYGWVFPKREGLSIGIGGIFGAKEKVKPYQYFTTFVKELSFINEGKAKRVVGHRLPCFFDEGQKVSQGRVLLVGDAGYLMDPLTGEGIYYAVQSGMLAAEAIIQSKVKGIYPSVYYQNAVRNQIFENLKWALHVSRIIYRFTKLSYRTLKQYPELGHFCLQVLEGQESYQSFVLKVKERMKDLIRGRFGERIRKAMART